MRPIFFGVVLFFVGMIGWATFEILSKITIGFIGSLKFPFLIEMFKILAILSLPVALCLEILLQIFGRKL